MITKQQALKFIDELSKEFAIKMDLASGVDCYFEVYSDEAGTHRLEGNFDSIEELKNIIKESRNSIQEV